MYYVNRNREVPRVLILIGHPVWGGWALGSRLKCYVTWNLRIALGAYVEQARNLRKERWLFVCLKHFPRQRDCHINVSVPPVLIYKSSSASDQNTRRHCNCPKVTCLREQVRSVLHVTFCLKLTSRLKFARWMFFRGLAHRQMQCEVFPLALTGATGLLICEH